MGVTHHGRTHRLDLADPTLREWECTVLAVDPERGIVLDRSAFYPGGGGQPPDHGVLLWQGVQTRIVGTRKGDDLYLIPADGDPVPPPGKWAAVVWYSPSAYYNPTYISKTCKPGYVPRSSGGRPYCLACSPGTTLVSAGGNFVCAKCPPGYSYYIYQGKPYCKTPS